MLLVKLTRLYTIPGDVHNITALIGAFFYFFTVGRLGQVVLAFSALSNGRKILHCGAPPPDSLTCVHGLRFLSLAWVIMVHTYLQVFTIAGKKVYDNGTLSNLDFYNKLW